MLASGITVFVVTRNEARKMAKDENFTPAKLEFLRCSDNMERRRESVPAFRYSAALFPPYGDTKHHWYIIADSRNGNKHVSLITNSKEDILNYINNASTFTLCFVT